MSATDDLQAGLGEAYDTLSQEFQPNVTVTLLQASASADEFDSLLEVTSKRFFEYSNFRKNTLLQIADTSSDLTTAMASATHVSIDSVVYVIRNGDTLPPSGTNPVWMLYLDLFEKAQRWAPL
jgi:hypothetical protein